MRRRKSSHFTFISRAFFLLISFFFFFLSSAKFSPSPGIETYTSSIRATRTPPKRSTTVSERIAQRFKEIQLKGVGAVSPAVPKKDVIFESGLHNTAEDSEGSETEKESPPAPKVDKGKGKAVNGRQLVTSAIPVSTSPQPASPLLSPNISVVPPPQLIVLSGLSLSPAALSSLLTRAAAELPLRPVRFPLLGEYQDCFAGEEFVRWLCKNVKEFNDSLDAAEDAARELTENEGLLRRIGEFGNAFECTDSAFYQFRPKVGLFSLPARTLTLSGMSLYRPLTWKTRKLQSLPTPPLLLLPLPII